MLIQELAIREELAAKCR